jgi:GGDEF domain-containing protein
MENHLRSGPVCVVMIDLTVTLPSGERCGHSMLGQIYTGLAPRVVEPFRAFDSVARIGPLRFAVIFAGSLDQAQGRQEGIARSISGSYASPGCRVTVEAGVEVLQIASLASARALVSEAAETATAALKA